MSWRKIKTLFSMYFFLSIPVNFIEPSLFLKSQALTFFQLMSKLYVKRNNIANKRNTAYIIWPQWASVRMDLCILNCYAVVMWSSGWHTIKALVTIWRSCWSCWRLSKLLTFRHNGGIFLMVITSVYLDGHNSAALQQLQP